MGKKTKTPKLAKKEKGILIGKISVSRARKIGCVSADVYLTVNYIKHIESRHSKELGQLGIGVENYVRMILDQFNEVREGSGDSLLLIVRSVTTHSDVAAISLVYDKPNNWWKIKTAEPRGSADIDKRKLLWKDGQCP